MEPWGNPTRTDAQGRFSVPMTWMNGFLLALDRERKNGALFVVDVAGFRFRRQARRSSRSCGCMAPFASRRIRTG